MPKARARLVQRKSRSRSAVKASNNEQQQEQTSPVPESLAVRATEAHKLTGVQRQAVVQQIAEQYGNRQAQRMITSMKNQKAVQRAGASTVDKPEAETPVQEVTNNAHDLSSPRFKGDAKLEAIFDDEDRLRQGDKGEPVIKIQQALLDLGYNLGDFGSNQDGVDGNYGPKTGAAVKQFKTDQNLTPNTYDDVGPKTMARLDQLFPDAGGTNTTPPGTTTDNPPSGKDTKKDAELEDMLDAIWLQYQLLFKVKDDALSRLEKDLENQEKPGNLAADILKFVSKAALSAVFGPGEKFIEQQIINFLKDDSVEKDEDDNKKKCDSDSNFVIESGVKPIFEAVKKASEDKINDKIDQQLEHNAPSLDAFIDGQRNSITEAGAEAQETFLLKTKPALRQPAQSQPNPANGDARVSRAEKLLKALKNKRGNAFELQYDESLRQWAVGLAQSKLARTDQQGTDLSKGNLEKTDLDETSGVIRLKIDGDTPDKPIKIEKAEIAGLSKKTRERLNKENPTILGLGYPTVVEGKVNPGFLGIDFLKFFNSSITISQNEKGEVFESGSSEGGKEWLKQKALREKNSLPDDSNIRVDEQEGAVVVFRNEIDQKHLEEIPDGLQGP